MNKKSNNSGSQKSFDGKKGSYNGKKKNNSNGRGNYGKGNKGREREDYSKDDVMARDQVKPGGNAVEWYVPDNQILADTASLGFSENAGTAYDIYKTDPTKGTLESRDYAPAIMTLDYLPVIGPNSVDGHGSDIVNITAKYIWAKIRSTNAGAKNYDSPDLMMYLLAAKELYANYFEILRAYGVINTINFKNRYVARYIVEALGFDYDDLTSNLANFRASINLLAIRIGALAVPAVFPLFARSTWLNMNLYTDSPLSKAQQYAFKPTGYYVWSSVAMETGSALLYTPHKSKRTTADIIAYMNEMLDPLIADSDTTTMSGDIEKAYSNSLVKLPLFDETFSTVPMYNMEVLMEIHNATTPVNLWSDASSTYHSYSIQQDAMGSIYQNFEIDSSQIHSFAMPDLILDVPVESPTAADVMVATRFTTASTRTPSVHGWRYDVYGTEIPISFTVHFFRELEGYASEREFISVSFNTFELDLPIWYLPIWSQFDWAPRLELFTSGTLAEDPYNFVGRLWDLNNYTVINPERIQMMHDTAVTAEFGIPKLVGNIV